MRQQKEPETPEEQIRIEKRVRARQARRLSEAKLHCLGPCDLDLPESDFPLAKSADGESSFRQAVCIKCVKLLKKQAQESKLKVQARKRNRATKQ